MKQIIFFKYQAIKLILVLAFFSLPLLVFSASLSSDAIATRVISNPKFLSPLAWYQTNIKNQGSPQVLTVDGYEAVRDGRTVYVNAANIDIDNNKFYTNIYLLSFNQNVERATEDIFGQLLTHWKFNTNILSKDTDKCRMSTTKACLRDSDCTDQAGDYCLSDKAKIIRDTRRLADLGEMNLALANYKKDTFPRLLSGSYVASSSVSTWPSWQATLGQELGVNLPLDPINKFNPCPNHDEKTCWNQADKNFYFNFNGNAADGLSIAKSLVYWYKNGQFNISLENDSYENLKNIRGINFSNQESALYFDTPLNDIVLSSGDEYSYRVKVINPQIGNPDQYDLGWSLADNYENMITIQPTNEKNVVEIKVKTKIVTPLTIDPRLEQYNYGGKITISNPPTMPDNYLFSYKCTSPYYSNPAIDTYRQIDSYYGAIRFSFNSVGDTMYTSKPYDDSLCDGQQHQIEINSTSKLINIGITAPTFAASRPDFLNCLTLDQYSFSEFKKLSGEKNITVNILDRSTNKVLIGDFKIDIYECGNGVVDPTELCDINKNVVGGKCCENGAYYGNSGADAIYTVGCKNKTSCSYIACNSSNGYGWDNNTKTCYKHCGDGQLNYGEQCDASLGLSGWDCLMGTYLYCSANCTRVCNTGTPYQGDCGNDIIEGPEVCDGNINTPTNAICVEQCSKWKCNNEGSPTGFHKEEDQCKSNTRTNDSSCLVNGATTANQIWDQSLNNGAGGWGVCQITECDTAAGYTLSGGRCVAGCQAADYTGALTVGLDASGVCKVLTCNEGADYYLNANNGTCINCYAVASHATAIVADNGQCKATACENGWHVMDNNSSGQIVGDGSYNAYWCQADIIPCSVANGTGQTIWGGAGFGNCQVVSCDSANGYHLSYDGKSCTNLTSAVCDTAAVLNGEMSSTYMVGLSQWGSCQMRSTNSDYPFCFDGTHPSYPGQKVCVNACGTAGTSISIVDQIFAEGVAGCYVNGVNISIKNQSNDTKSILSGPLDGKVNFNISAGWAVNNNKCAFIYKGENIAGSSLSGTCNAGSYVTNGFTMCVKIDYSNPYNWDINQMPASYFDPDLANCFN